MKIPKQIKTIKLEPLRELCKNYLIELAEEGCADEDFPIIIYEAAMEVFYGKNVWEWVNNKLINN